MNEQGNTTASPHETVPSQELPRSKSRTTSVSTENGFSTIFMQYLVFIIKFHSFIKLFSYKDYVLFVSFASASQSLTWPKLSCKKNSLFCSSFIISGNLFVPFSDLMKFLISFLRTTNCTKTLLQHNQLISVWYCRPTYSECFFHKYTKHTVFQIEYSCRYFSHIIKLENH